MPTKWEESQVKSSQEKPGDQEGAARPESKTLLVSLPLTPTDTRVPYHRLLFGLSSHTRHSYPYLFAGILLQFTRSHLLKRST